MKDGESEAQHRPGHHRGRCLILVPRGFDAPPDLLQGLRQRGVALDEVGDAPAVMVALARGRYLSLVIVEPQAVLELEELLDSVRQYHGPMPIWRYLADRDPRLSRLTPRRERGNPGAAPGQERIADQPTTANGAAKKQVETPPPRPGSIAGRIRPSNRRLPDRAEEVAPRRRPSEPHTSGPTLRYAGDDGPEGQASPQEEASPEPTEPPEIRVTLSEEELAMLLDEDFDAGASPSDEQEKER